MRSFYIIRTTVYVWEENMLLRRQVSYEQKIYYLCQQDWKIFCSHKRVVQVMMGKHKLLPYLNLFTNVLYISINKTINCIVTFICKI